MRVVATTERLDLAQVEPGDWRIVAGLARAPGFDAFNLGSRDEPATDAQVQAWVAFWCRQYPRGLGMWCVRLREGAAWIGTAGVKPRRGHEDQLELKYNLVRSAWGRGLGTEAARAALELAGVSDVVAVIDPDNHRSQRVATKLAFRLAQTLVDDGRPTELWRRP